MDRKGNPMSMIREQVRHNQFEAGTIVGQTETTITVEFGGQFGTKLFAYPSAFESFLELCNPVLKKEMDELITRLRAQRESERKQRADLLEKQTAAQKQHEEERRILFELKRAGAKKASPAKKSPAQSKKAAVPSKTNASKKPI